jgi:ribosome recycling factor
MDAITLEGQGKVNKTIEVLADNLRTLRTGRASAAILDNIECDYYGDKILINQIASISIPEPRQLLIKPYDRGDLKSISNAIISANIGLNPIVDTDSVRLVMPALTEDSRKELVKKAKVYTENCKVAIRNLRRDYIDLIKSDDTMSEDLQKRIEEEFQKVIDDSMKKVDAVFADKEKEIMAI